MRIDQFVPGMSVGDAVSNHALEIQKMIQEQGTESLIYSVFRHVSPHMKPACLDYRQFNGSDRPENILIYHFSIGSPLTPLFCRFPGKKVMVYHNITPACFFQGVNEEKAKVVEEGRKQLKELALVPDLALGVSEYNRRELVEAGFKTTGVLPLVIDRAKLETPPHVKLLNRYRDGKINFLFVGRVAPNKRFEDLIRVFYYYQKTVNPNSRLILVGPYTGMEKYYAYLKALVMELDLKEVVFTGHVSDADLKTYFRLADLFLCMSEHEGFCIPLMEAMHYNLPVIAYDSSAIGETLAGTGVLVREKNFLEIAELAGKILSDSPLRHSLVEKQKSRLADFSREKIGAVLKNYLESLSS